MPKAHVYGVTGLVGSVLLVASASSAWAEVKEQGTLTATQACEAFTSKNTKANPGTVHLEVGKAYPVSGRNAAGGEWLHISIEGIESPRRWVEQGCGTLVLAAAAGQESAKLADKAEQKAPEPQKAASPTPQAPVAQAPTPQVPAPQTPPKAEPPKAEAKVRPPAPTFAPFFDTIQQSPVDDTPPPPTLTAFDEGVLTLCGPWDSAPRAEAFETTILTVFPDQLAAVQKAVGGGLKTPNATPAIFAKELTEAWFENKAFKHIFCGDPNKRALGGLHFQGRYLQAQRAGWAGLLEGTQCAKSEAKAPVYSIGVSYLTPDGEAEKACPKSYSTAESALDILTNATKALKASRQWAKPDEKAACLYGVATPKGSYSALLVVKNQAILTAYPITTPNPSERSCQ